MIYDAALIQAPITANSFLPTFEESLTINVDKTRVATLPSKVAVDIAAIFPK